MSRERSLSARELILALVDSAAQPTLSASYFVAAAELMGLDAGNVRVTLARLVRDGTLASAGRGVYERGERRVTIKRLVRGWAEVESNLTRWSGGWRAVSIAHLGRRDRSRLRSRERALSLLGFASSAAGLWLRPDNLQTPLPALRQQLVDLGLDDNAPLLAISAAEPAHAVDPASLWPRRQLETGYRRNLERLAASAARLPDLDDDDAARETLLLGRAVTRAILLDPLLPAELVDAELRGELISAMRRYDRIGKRLWGAFYSRHEVAQSRAQVTRARS
jgi:phenylacetic acid degradation operon negative regulatory protein